MSSSTTTSSSSSRKKSKSAGNAASTTPSSHRWMYAEWETRKSDQHNWQVVSMDMELELEEGFQGGNESIELSPMDDDNRGASDDDSGNSEEHVCEDLQKANYGQAQEFIGGLFYRNLRRSEIPTAINMVGIDWEYEKPRGQWNRLALKDRERLEVANLDNRSEVYIHLSCGSYACNPCRLTMSQPHIARSRGLKLRRTVYSTSSTTTTPGTATTASTSQRGLPAAQSASAGNKGASASKAKKSKFAKWILPYTPKQGVTEPPTCVICQEDIEGAGAVTLKCRTKCAAVFHEDCVVQWLDHKSECPICKQILGQLRGDSPPGRMTWRTANGSVPGFGNCGIIEITYDIPDGIQGPKHPSPGQRFAGTYRFAYLPNTTEGQKVLRLLKKAFDAGLTFTVGTSLTTGQSNCVVWSGLHHKTVIAGGPFGYPDPTYLMRIQEELKYKGITDDDEEDGEEDAEDDEE